jgi:hypothetical protein
VRGLVGHRRNGFKPAASFHVGVPAAEDVIAIPVSPLGQLADVAGQQKGLRVEVHVG